MPAGLIEHELRERPQTPADVWATNRGIYLGLTAEGRTNQTRPLAGKDSEPSVGRGYDFRTTWKPDGRSHLYVGEGHVASFGPQGVGKTRKLYMPNLFKLRDWSCVVIDPKGENCAHTALARAANKNHRVFVIDPMKVMETNYPNLYRQNPKLFTSCGLNPEAALDPQKPSFIDDAKGLSMALISSDDSRDPYWPMAAQALTRGLLMVLKLDKPGTSDNLSVFRDYLGMSPELFAKAIQQDIAKFGARWPAIAASLSEFARFNPDDRELGGIRRTAKTQTDWLDSPLIRADLAKPNVIDPASLKHTPTTIYIILPPKYLVTHGTWLRLIVTAILQPLLDSVEFAPVPVLFMLDEFAQLGRMNIIENNVAQMRGFGIKLWTVWQDIQQVKDIYKDAWHRFLSTAEAKITFTSHHVDTREYFSKLADERFYVHTTHSYSLSSSSSENKGTSNTSHYLSAQGSYGSSDGFNSGTSATQSTNQQHINERRIKPYEIAALDADEALIFARRGFVHRSICPQPEMLPGVREAILAARDVIDGRQQKLA